MITFKSHNSSSAGNLYTASNGSTTLLVEAGLRLPGIRKALDFQLSGISGCLVTHSHADHAKGTRDLMKAGIDCYMTKDTAAALKLSGHRLQTFEPLRKFMISEFEIMPFPTEHDTPGSVGYIISDGEDKLLFLTDTAYCRYKFVNLTMIAIECNWSEETLSPTIDPVVKRRLYKSHMSLERCLTFFAANDLRTVRAIHLLHLSDGNSNEKLFKETIQKATGCAVYVAGK